MALNDVIKHPRGTRANLDALAAANGLVIGQVYHITDQNRIAVATAVNAYTAFVKEVEALTGWASDVTGTGTGASQGLTLPESGLANKDVIVWVNGQQWDDFSIATTTLTLTAPSGATLRVRRMSGVQGPQGATGNTGAAGAGLPTGGSTGQRLKKISGTNYDYGWYDELDSKEFLFSAGGGSLATGVYMDYYIPFDCVPLQWTLLANASGSIVIDIWKDTYTNFPPTVADTITAAAKPTLSSASKNQNSTLTGWTTTWSKGEILRFNIDSVATVTRVLLVLDLKKT